MSYFERKWLTEVMTTSIEVYGRADCIACSVVTEFLDMNHAEYQYFNTDFMSSPDLQELIDRCKQINSDTQLPIIFRNGEKITYEQLKQYITADRRSNTEEPSSQ